MSVDKALAERLIAEHRADLQPNARLGKVRRYLAGEHDKPYMPRGAKKEYEHLAERAITNWLPLLSRTFRDGLHVDGFRPEKSASNAPAWDYWQANGLDARQSVAHGGAIDYGTSYTIILPGTLQTRRVPIIRPLSPLRSAAWYVDDDDEFPEIAFRERGATMDGALLFEFLDNENVYTFAETKDDAGQAELHLSGVDAHGLGVTPFVRFRESLDGESHGLIRPVIEIQNRVNEIVFSTLIAMQYASFRQRWATGISIPEDEDGNPVEPFKAAVDRLWISDSPDAKFGDFAQTDISGNLNAYTETVRTLAATSQVAPTVFTGDMINVSDTALAALEKGQQRRTDSMASLFGESWESALRLGALAAGDSVGASDTSAQVRWRDTEARSFAATVDALGKIAQSLQVPVEGLWEQIPGVTDQDVDYWRALREEGDPLTAMVSEFHRQTAPPAAAASAPTGSAEPAAPTT